MASRHSALVRRIMKYLKSLPRSQFEVSQPGTEAGWPDIKGCLDGRYVGLEVKIGKDKPSRLQAYTLEQLRNAGAIAGVVRSVADVKALLGRR